MHLPPGIIDVIFLLHLVADKADTNSTWIFFPSPSELRPKSLPCSSILRIIEWLVALATKKLMKPGPATSTFSMVSIVANLPTIISASARGDMPAGFASVSATFEA
jgi:hypothetical protein